MSLLLSSRPHRNSPKTGRLAPGECACHSARRPVVMGFFKFSGSDSVPIVFERFLEQKLVTSSRLWNIAPQDSHDESSRKSMYSCALSSPRSSER